MNTKEKKLIGYWGYPHPDKINEIRLLYPDADFIDLDVDYGYPATNILPEAYCRIIRNIADNTIYLKNELVLILAAVGRDKCDSAFFTAKILKQMGFNVLETTFESYQEARSDLQISTSDLPLIDKINTVMDGITQINTKNYVKSNPKFGFWGVPPNDFKFLELFPKETHLYGWLRCVEAKRPADLDLEMLVDEGVPTVFFAQAFCAKMQLAKYLAQKYNGLYIDIDDVANKSVMAKVEAFINLR